MIKALLLICSVYVPVDNCDRHRALDIIEIRVPFGTMGMGGQIDAIDKTHVAGDWGHYIKVVGGQ